MSAVKVITVEKSRELENRANAGGLSFAAMMENAGRAVAHAIQQRLPVKGARAVVLIGPGNNGGDGLVAAHALWEMGARVTCYIWKRKTEDDANLRRVKEDRLPLLWAEDDEGFEALRGLLSAADVVVDALLGVGVSRPIGGLLAELLAVVRQSLAEAGASPGLASVVPPEPGRPPLVVAVDCPTGLNCDTGDLDPAALPADVTVTFAHPKVGLLRFPGAAAVGEIVVADIGIPPELADDVALEMATAPQVRDWLPARPPAAHKGTFGRALIVAGSVNYVGAAALAGAGAARIGTGLVTIALPQPIQSAVAAHLAEATYLLLPHDMGVLTADAVPVLGKRLADYDALLLGPGLTQEDEAVALVHALVGLEPPSRKSRLGFVARAAAEGEEREWSLPPLVVDADGLNALSRADGWQRSLPPDTILTPHPGEMARLMGAGTTTRDVQADREGVAGRMAAEWGAVVVLKGALTVVAAPDGRLMVVPFANPGLATAGSGDVLAGAIVGLRAQGMGAFEAAAAGAYLHGLAGELARAELGDMGMAAGDLPPRLPLALRRVRR